MTINNDIKQTRNSIQKQTFIHHVCMYVMELHARETEAL